MIDSPPRPPQDELDALIREARERQLRRRLRGAAAVAIAAAATLGIYALLSGSTPRSTAGRSRSAIATTCRLTTLALSLQTQGTATEAVTFLILRNPHASTCSISAPAVFEVTANGHRAQVVGDPLRDRLHMTLHGTKRSYFPLQGVWWGNWCGSRNGLRMTARVGSRSLTTSFHFVPLCNQPSHKSTLR